MPGADSRPLLVWAGAMVLAALVFTLWPGIDLWVSGFFYGPDGFAAARWGIVEGVRRLMWQVSEAAILVALLGLGLGLATGRPALWLPARLWGFVLAVYAVGPGVLVNLLLKEHWGRARPDTVEAFGGGLKFTASLNPAAECARNCSFVSGETASAAALAVGMVVVLRHLRPRISQAIWRAGLAFAAGVVVLGMATRLMVGRHFLSDVTFAVLIVLGVALMLDRPFRAGLVAVSKDTRNRGVPVLTTPATPPIRRDT
ncbi:MAG: phosphatase PAP2 family protein [Gemmobacter sp.]